MVKQNLETLFIVFNLDIEVGKVSCLFLPLTVENDFFTLNNDNFGGWRLGTGGWRVGSKGVVDGNQRITQTSNLQLQTRPKL